MTVIPFPDRKDPRTLICECDRAVLRSPAPHDADTIREACHALMLYGDPATDWWEGYHVMRSLDRPKLAKPPYSPQPRMIRAALVDFAGLAFIIAVATAVYHMGVS